MSDNKRNINSSIGKTIDYLRDLLGGKERNALERNLERDAFERDAMEGFQSIGTDDLEADLKELNKKLSSRVNKSKRVLIYRVAAGIAVILSLSISYLLVFDKQIDEFPENLQVSDRVENEDKADDKSLELPEEVSSQMDAEYLEDDINELEISPLETESKIENSQTNISEGDNIKPDIASLEENIAVVEDEDLTELSFEFAEESEVALTIENTETLAFQAPVEEISDKTVEAAPEAMAEIFDDETVIQKSASRAKKTAASPSVSREETFTTLDAVGSSVLTDTTSVISIEEVVIINTAEEKGKIDYTPAKPGTGMRKFRKYIEDSVNIRWNIPENKALVVIGFVINEKGKPQHFRIIESPDTTFSKETIRLVEKGPNWIPAKESGIYSTNETRLKIIFKN